MTESSRRTDAPPDQALALALDALSEEPAGLLTDFDGTLSPIVRDPMAAALVDGARDAIARLVNRLAVVAVVTGRSAMDARRMTGVRGLLVAGNHGTEWLEPDADRPVASAGADAARQAVARALSLLSLPPGVDVEDKGISATLHYRRATDPEATRARLVGALAGVAPGLEVKPGRMSLELRAPGIGDKGAAARAIVERHGLRGAVVMGDDVTDLDMFAALADLRAAGRLRAAIIAVGGDDAEVPSQVAAAADAVVPDPAGAAALLAAVAQRLEAAQAAG